MEPRRIYFIVGCMKDPVPLQMPLPCRPCPQLGRRTRKSEPMWFASAPPRSHLPGSLQPSHWRPRFFYDDRRRSNRQPPSCRGKTIGDSAMPRRGHSVAAVKVPCWYLSVMLEERRPRWFEPRDPLRGRPERSAPDPRHQRNRTARDQRDQWRER